VRNRRESWRSVEIPEPAERRSTTSPEFVRALDACWLLISDFVTFGVAVGVLKVASGFLK
jgi:hypothetical protein